MSRRYWNTDADLIHMTCCDSNIALCGIDVSALPWVEGGETPGMFCAACVHLDQYECTGDDCKSKASVALFQEWEFACDASTCSTPAEWVMQRTDGGRCCPNAVAVSLSCTRHRDEMLRWANVMCIHCTQSLGRPQRVFHIEPLKAGAR